MLQLASRHAVVLFRLHQLEDEFYHHNPTAQVSGCVLMCECVREGRSHVHAFQRVTLGMCARVLVRACACVLVRVSGCVLCVSACVRGVLMSFQCASL